MGTINGARGLGWDAAIGSLDAGKRADFVVVPIAGSKSSDAMAELFESTAAPRDVFIHGNSILV
jgi:imidazolonepropionase-like amidohydrolase